MKLSRVQERPFREADIPVWEDWLAYEPCRLAVADLIPTQEYLVIDRLLEIHAGMARRGGDIPRIVVYHGRNFIFDGHHAWALALLAGEEAMQVRCYHHPYEKAHSRQCGYNLTRDYRF